MDTLIYSANHRIDALGNLGTVAKKVLKLPDSPNDYRIDRKWTNSRKLVLPHALIDTNHWIDALANWRIVEEVLVLPDASIDSANLQIDTLEN